MQLEGKLCTNCGRNQPLPGAGGKTGDGVCPACNAPLDGGALSKFADRLARFGLGATPQPLLNRLPGLPDAK
jgi:hypothetical protein